MPMSSSDIQAVMTMKRIASAPFTGLSYHEIEQSGPPSPPLGFSAPKTYPAVVQSMPCMNGDGSIHQVTVLMRQGHCNNKSRGAMKAYLMPGTLIRDSICGEIRVCLELQCLSNTYFATNQRVAIKMDRRQIVSRLHNAVSNHHPLHSENPWKEVSAYELLGDKNPNVMSMMEALVDEDNLYLVMPYYQRSLYQLMLHHPQGLPEARARRYFQQILAGIYQLHAKGICHRDISTHNILLGDDNDSNNDTCVLCDLGMSLRIPHSFPDDHGTEDCTDIRAGTVRRLIHSQSHCGKLAYMAPDIYTKQESFEGLSIDLWSAAVVLFVMLTGRTPYRRPDLEDDAGFHDLMDPFFYWDDTKVCQLHSWGHAVSPEAVDLLHGMFRYEPCERLTLAQVAQHPWVVGASLDTQ